MSGAIEAGRAVLRLLLDDSDLDKKFTGLERELSKISKSVFKVGAAFGAVGAAITAPLALATQKFAKFGSELNDMSARTGVSVESLSAFKFGADQTGTSIAALETGLRKMQVTIVEAGSGVDTAAAALNRLGISLRDIQGIPPEKQFELIAQKLRLIPDPAERAAAAVAIFGRGGTALLPLVNDLDVLVSEARAAGVTMSDETAAAADELGDAFDKLNAITNSVSVTIGATLAPALLDILPIIASQVGELNEWIAANPQLILGIAAVGAGALAVSAILVPLAAAIKAVSAALAIAAAVGLTVGGTFAIIALSIATVLLLLVGLAAWFAGGFDELVSAVGTALGAFTKLGEGAKKTTAEVTAAQRRQNLDMRALYQKGTEDKVKAAEDARRQLQAIQKRENEQTIAQEKRYLDERARQRRTSLENFQADNAEKLAEAEELERKLFLSTLSPSRRKEIEEKEQLAAENAELNRQWELLKNINQLRQDSKIGGILDRANTATSKLAAGRIPTADERRALGFVNGDGGKEAKNMIAELKKHTSSLDELVRAVRDNPGGFPVGNN